MKKNITINLFGTLYNIDDDAYQLLERYLDSMKRYFSRQDGGEEIADDIEHRVAELLWQKKNDEGMEAVNIDTVKEIIGKIGNASEIDENNENESGNNNVNIDGDGNGNTSYSRNGSNSSFNGTGNDNTNYSGAYARSYFDSLKGKRMYRDKSDKMLAGVCKGMANFFGGDVVIWRLSVVLLTLLFSWLDYVGIIPLLYIVLCFIVPVMDSPEDRLRMKGQKVSPENINAEIISESERVESQPQTTNNGCLSGLLKLGILICSLPLLFLIFIFIVALFAVFASWFGLAGSLFPYLATGDMAGAPEIMSSYGSLLILGLIAAISVIAIPIYVIIKMIRGEKFSGLSITAIILTWLLCLAIGIFSFTSFGMNWAKEYDKHHVIQIN